MFRRTPLVYSNPSALVGNVITNPYDLTNVSWDGTVNLTRTANQHLAPDGSMDADLVAADTTNGFHGLTQRGMTTTGGNWVLRGRFKPAGYHIIDIGVANNNSFTKNVAWVVNFANCTSFLRTAASYVGSTMNLRRLANHWVLFELVVPAVDANSTHRVDLTIEHTPLVTSYTGNTVSGLYGWGVEFAPVPN